MRILLRMIHCIQKGVAIQHIHIHVVARSAEERVKRVSQVDDAVLGN